MSLNPNYRIVFRGEIRPGVDPDEVKNRLQRLLKTDANQLTVLFSGKTITVKKGLAKAEAIRYQRILQDQGAIFYVEPGLQAGQSHDPIACDPRQLPPVGAAAVAVRADEAPHSPVQPQANSIQTTDINNAFSGSLPKIKLPAQYRLGIIAIGVVMVLLPLLYFGIIAAVGYGVYFHVTGDVAWIRSMGHKFGIIAYVTPVVVGIAVILFMIKPIFAQSGTGPKELVLDPRREPLVFYFVNKIADVVGAPRPKQVVVDCKVNASASFRKGLLSFFGSDLVLTIGMPLVAGFNTRQLAGVLAHEFGHFSQGTALRFHYLTFTINRWFEDAVYQRDNWDRKLEELSRHDEGWVSTISNVARGCIWGNRQMLKLFMWAAEAISSYMLRQMEFDADRYEARLAGSSQFENTTLRLQKLGIAEQISFKKLEAHWERKQLVEDLPSFIAHNADQLPEDLDHKLLISMKEQKTQLYDTHPSDMERVKNALAQNAQPLFTLDRDARDLFKNYEVLAKQVTYFRYFYNLNLEVEQIKLIKVAEAAAT